MSGKEKADPDFSAASTWELRHHAADEHADDHSSYFFDTHDDYKESTILSEFGWNIPPESSGSDGVFADFSPIEPDLAARRAVADSDMISSSIEPRVEASAAANSPSNPSVSSSSSDEQPEKSSSSAAAASPPADAA